ncbi:hypothetical protein AK812_SmicGene7552 [Symbiodinium microadriaticum]|uniref:C3H1-type domain-containing protein n=1 Tax=Symbiodinium microadriaticum TaxID=2951 RepID=A0A1Q9ENB1_SYMMI|nr:hypothetical protein AK812_SmicGene7552 [Symbiodinium microadriaticum]
MALLDGPLARSIEAEVYTEVTFVYRHTFIVEAKGGAQVSQPPPMTRLETACDAMTEEETLRGELREQRAPIPLHLARTGRGKRPCIYFVSGKCTPAEHCNYCHMEHKDRSAKLDKQQRHKFNLMGMREALLMLQGMLTSNARENGFLHLARDTLDLVEEEAMKHDATEVTSSEAVYRRLDRVLVRMSFHQLALLAVSKADCSEFGEIMVTSLEKLTDDLEGRPSQTNLLAALSFLQLGCLAIPMSTLMAADPSDCLSRRRPRLEDGHRCATRKMWLSTGDVAAGTASERFLAQVVPHLQDRTVGDGD